jgi:hypothetical protein
MMNARTAFVILARSDMQAPFQLPIWQLDLASCTAESPDALIGFEPPAG